MQVRNGASSTAADTAARTVSSIVTGRAEQPLDVGGDGLALGGVAVDDDDLRAFRGEAAAGGLAHAGRATGHERRGVLERHSRGSVQNEDVPMIPYPRRLANLAAADPAHPAITDEYRTLTRAELESLASDMAEEFAALSVGQGDIVVLALPNCVEFLAAMIASWKVGATPTPVSSRLPKRELDGIIELAAPALIVGVEPADHPGSTCLRWKLAPASPRGAPRHRLGPVEGMTSGGSTGRRSSSSTRRLADRSRRRCC
jgi:non-ribosomal peptide synthetase component F